jgi:hypothetical protein
MKTFGAHCWAKYVEVQPTSAAGVLDGRYGLKKVEQYCLC